MDTTPAAEPGKGCGTGSDGSPCSPAYLCPACIDLLLSAPSDEHTHECRDCSAEIVCCFAEDECEWSGGNDGCTSEDCRPDMYRVAPLACSECGQTGTYVPGAMRPTFAGDADVACVTRGCFHTANWRDFDLDAGESLLFVDGILHVRTPA
jgi:hypothetical protein